jgi:hypothetical protein
MRCRSSLNESAVIFAEFPWIDQCLHPMKLPGWRVLAHWVPAAKQRMSSAGWFRQRSGASPSFGLLRNP